jgi:hypothetical protein
VFLVRYELGFYSYIQEDDILHGHCSENLRSYIVRTSSCNASRRALHDVLVSVTGKRDVRPASQFFMRYI